MLNDHQGNSLPPSRRIYDTNQQPRKAMSIQMNRTLRHQVSPPKAWTPTNRLLTAHVSQGPERKLSVPIQDSPLCSIPVSFSQPTRPFFAGKQSIDFLQSYPGSSETFSSNGSHERSMKGQYSVPALQHMAGLKSQDPPLPRPDLLLRGFSGPLIPQRESPARSELGEAPAPTLRYRPWPGQIPSTSAASPLEGVSYDSGASQSMGQTSWAYQAPSQQPSRPPYSQATWPSPDLPPLPYGHSQPHSNGDFIGNQSSQGPMTITNGALCHIQQRRSMRLSNTDKKGHPRVQHGRYPRQDGPLASSHTRHTQSASSKRQPSSLALAEKPKRRRPPKPYSSYANMLADIICKHPRRKRTLEDLYQLLKDKFPDHFPDDGENDTKSRSGSGWRNSVRHALSVNKWFKKQHRTHTDARLDEKNPNRYEPPPMDTDLDNEGRPITVAPATHRECSSVGLGGDRLLKGGYWFIRERYRHEVAEAMARDKEKSARLRQEREEEEKERERLQSRKTPQSYIIPKPIPGQLPEEEEEHRRRMHLTEEAVVIVHLSIRDNHHCHEKSKFGSRYHVFENVSGLQNSANEKYFV